MIQSDNVIIFDIDGTICKTKEKDQEYLDLEPEAKVLQKLLDYHSKGFYIILFTARQMRTHNGNIGKINANTASIVLQWLEKFSIPYDEIHFGKPWCGNNGFYVDDKAIRPDEFVNLSYEEIQTLIGN